MFTSCPARTLLCNAALAFVLGAPLACKSNPAPAPAPVAEQGSASALSLAPSGAAAALPPAETAAAAGSEAAPGAEAPAASAKTGARGVAVPNPANGILAAGAADKIRKIGDPSSVTLLDPGGEPRAAMSYALAKGPARPLTVSLDMLMGLKSGEKSMPPTAVPRMKMTLDLSVHDKNAEGDWKVDGKLRGVTIEPKGATEEQIAGAMRPHLDGMKGLAMGYWVSPQGNVRDVKVELPAGVAPEAQQMLTGMNQSFESMIAPLPKDPIGVGAKWQVVSRLQSSGADILQFAIYTLKSRDGTKADLDLSVTQLAANETINAPGMPPGVTARLKSFKSGGNGGNQIDLKDVGPDKGRLDVKSAMEIAVDQGAGGKAESMSVDSTMKVQYSRSAK